ncbi:MAG: hypothetical protein JSW73_01480 [Candidatus Woesearchaeota archaeon]|nr:MAG: hypothetical protein JSW73_01480 [Candidatus Woesearchaeota archaeon]
MNIKYPLIIASILIVVILISGCTEVIGSAKDKTCNYCKSGFKSECNKCPEGVKNDYVTVNPTSGKCVEQCYGVSVPLTTNCDGLREICKQVFGDTTPSGGDETTSEETVSCEDYCKSRGYTNGGCEISDVVIIALNTEFGCLGTECQYGAEVFDTIECSSSASGSERQCLCLNVEQCGSDPEECDSKCTAEGCTG